LLICVIFIQGQSTPMMLLSRRSLLSIAAVVDIAVHARPKLVSAKQLSKRHNLPTRHLEPVMQALVRHDILVGVRGPSGGYELARERRKITAGDVVRAAMTATGESALPLMPQSELVDGVIAPVVRQASDAFLTALDAITIHDLCEQAEKKSVFQATEATQDFTI
jgi:Rrf2 family transcriptional regulator, iron-sulfur cluster assembly transcription factor